MALQGDRWLQVGNRTEIDSKLPFAARCVKVCSGPSLPDSPTHLGGQHAAPPQVRSERFRDIR